MQGLESVEIGLLKLFILIGLEFEKRGDIAFDLCDHEIKFLDMFYRTLILSVSLFLPNIFKQFEMVSLLTDHLLLLILLLLFLEFY